MGIEATQLGAGSLGGEHPLDLGLGRVATSLPRGNLPLQPLAIGDAPAQALALENADLDLGRVQPAGVLGREVELEPTQEAMCLLGRKGLVECARRVGRAT